MTNPNLAKILALRGTLVLKPTTRVTVSTDTTHVPVRTSTQGLPYPRG
jgi:hypothetical protein